MPLGNQTSQWFAIYYLNSFDRLIKEKLKIKYYSRYMDDSILIHKDKEYLKYCLEQMKDYAYKLKLSFNEKTNIFPIKNGVDYLGWHIYLSDSGKIIRKVKQQVKYRYKRRLKFLQELYSSGSIGLDEITQILSSYQAHLSYGNTYNLRKNLLDKFVLKRESEN